jgi:hypothetical protein
MQTFELEEYSVLLIGFLQYHEFALSESVLLAVSWL